jgi:actin-related protein 5
MLHNFCEFAEDYPLTLRSLNIPANLRASERIIQFPFVLPLVEEKTEEELARITEKRKEQGKKLQEIAAKNRMEKVVLSSAFTAVLHADRSYLHSSCKRKMIYNISST